MYRILAIDYGQKNIGLALSDPMRLFSKPFKTINNNGIEFIITELCEIIRSQSVGKIVLGLPLSVAGLDTQKTNEVREFYEALAKRVDVPVILWDERYTTADAKEILIKKGLSIRDSKKVIDQTAAALILKSYLEGNKDA
ncbi:MAG TPA: Holliday junction resolvase RuvX [Candidatus Cloacimonadota bacterium]|nr:Holliday junction resolvase RuvX [Candidatus Cloacimonadota bacterium]HOD55357.1 Holliday junction resolvase RuvX [Candidatus Cloacimonadota bacterium]HPM01070.1 Holliday junction resolvase RuvX [Candidatus Cloacimonadota bacterium]